MEELSWIVWKPIFLDSGAFSAFTLGKNINIDDYCNFIKENQKFISTYAGLDVIWDWENTLKNIEYMKSQWLSPLPTYHFWSPVYYFEKYVNENSYIWIWWMVPLSRKPDQIRKLLDYVFSYIRNNNLKTKIHGWGMTNGKFMKRYPLYSVDSTWRLAWWKFKTMLFFDEKEWAIKSDNAEWIRKKIWRDRGKLHYSEINNHNIIQLNNYSKYVDKIHKIQWMQYRE